ncbi:MAG: phosphate acyltransferase [Treponemataceae bacterium]
MKVMKSLRDVMDAVKSAPPRKIAVSAAADEDILGAVGAAKNRGIADFILVGDRDLILKMAADHGVDVSSCEILDVKDPAESAKVAVGLVSGGKADIVMKGLVESSVFIKALLDPDTGLRVEGSVFSAIAVMDMREYDRLMFITDPGFVPAPDLETKKRLIENAVGVMKKLGIETPKVAVLSAVETVSQKMIATVEARSLQEMNEAGKISGCVVAGPISLDLAISEKSAAHKKYLHAVAGKADLLLVPTIEVGNALYKSMTYFAHIASGGVVAGTRSPVIFTSRSDTAETKLHTIALAVYLAGVNR